MGGWGVRMHTPTNVQAVSQRVDDHQGLHACACGASVVFFVFLFLIWKNEYAQVPIGCSRQLR